MYFLYHFTYLLAKEQTDDLQSVQMELRLIRRGDYEQHQIQHASLMQCPNHLIMQTGIVIGTTFCLRIGRNLQHITHQHQYAFNQQILFLAAYGKGLEWVEGGRWEATLKVSIIKNVLRQIPV